jgi:hypothetical protein
MEISGRIQRYTNEIKYVLDIADYHILHGFMGFRILYICKVYISDEQIMTKKLYWIVD